MKEFIDGNGNGKKRGGLRKISDGPKPPCNHPEHNPPSHIVLQPGVYEYTCPGCSRTVRFTVEGHYMSCGPGSNWERYTENKNKSEETIEILQDPVAFSMLHKSREEILLGKLHDHEDIKREFND